LQVPVFRFASFYFPLFAQIPCTKRIASLFPFAPDFLQRQGCHPFVTEFPPAFFLTLNLKLETRNSKLGTTMADVHDKVTRSFNMSRIKGKDTKPEMLVRRFLFAHGFRYRLNVKTLPGKPDIVLPKYKTVIFINGCFWHGHKGCNYFVVPKTRTEWWLSKIKDTQKRDREAEIQLNVLGWKVITLWECQLKPKKIQTTLELLTKAFQ